MVKYAFLFKIYKKTNLCKIIEKIKLCKIMKKLRKNSKILLYMNKIEDIKRELFCK